MELDWFLQDDGYATTSEKTRCTALIPLSGDRKDVYFAHDTWDDYRNLHSVIIHYNLPCDEFSSPRVTLSTQLGFVSNVDDFFITKTEQIVSRQTGAGLRIFETSMEVVNSTLYDLYVRPQTVMNWMRTALAAFAATNVAEWEDIFLKHNSGTYNNEYFIVDTKLLNGDTQVAANLVHTVLQVQGPARFIEDLTGELYSEGFISSFNVPKSREGAKYMEWNMAAALSGANGCNYNECPQYLISKRESPRLSNFRTFMRCAGYKRDAYSLYRGQPYHSYCISARGDTDDDQSKRKPAGGLNTKLCRASKRAIRIGRSIGAAAVYEAGDGLPDVWNFTWVTMSNPGFDLCGNLTSLEGRKPVNFCGWCGVDGKCLPGGEEGPYFEVSGASGWVAGKEATADVGLIVGLVIGDVIFLVVIIAALVAWKESERVPIV